MNITMIDHPALLQLMSWLSPAFPTGSFAYSGGLERAVHDQLVHDQPSLEVWISHHLHHGTLHTDGLFVGLAVEASADRERLAELNELALALAGSAERLAEMTGLGLSFSKAVAPWAIRPPAEITDKTYAIAIGEAAGMLSIAKSAAISAFLHSTISTQIQTALRLFPLGQEKGVKVLHAIEPMITEKAQALSSATIEDLGSFAPMADIASMKHAEMQGRLFRS